MGSESLATGLLRRPCLRPLVSHLPPDSIPHPAPPLPSARVALPRPSLPLLGVLGDKVRVSHDKARVTVSVDSGAPVAKRYIKYLVKKFLQKFGVRNYLRVIASHKDRNAYELKYYNISGDDEEEENDE